MILRMLRLTHLSTPTGYTSDKGEPIVLFDESGDPIEFSDDGNALPEGGPGVLTRAEADGTATWTEVGLLTNVKGVVVWDGTGAQPARPDFLSVEFVQEADPAAVAEDGDTWVHEA